MSPAAGQAPSRDNCGHELYECLRCGDTGCAEQGCESCGFARGLCRSCGHFEKRPV